MTTVPPIGPGGIPAGQRPVTPQRTQSVRDLKALMEAKKPSHDRLKKYQSERADLKARATVVLQPGQMVSGIVNRDMPASVIAAVAQHREPDNHLIDPKTHFHYPSIKAFMDTKGDPKTLESASVAHQAAHPDEKVPEAASKVDTYPLHFLSKARDALLDKWVNEEAEKRVKEKHGVDYQLSDNDKGDIETKKKEIKNDIRLMARMKEQFNEEVYAKQMKGNIDGNLYKPGAITAEMREKLQFKDDIPVEIYDNVSAMKAVNREISDYHQKFGTIKIISSEDQDKLYKEVFHVFNRYLEVYPEKNLIDAYVVCRDLARIAIYQMYFDKRAFTSSDHGIRHIYHNCENGHHMHKALEIRDQDPKAELLSHITHFYHDIGYSVGAARANFEVMKDHPFIGAAFIEANEEYFNKYFGNEATHIIKHAILNHAIVSFDSDVTDRYKMVRFTTSNSDACAVTADQKTQSFWVDHPETILQLARLRMFLTIYPECAKDFKYLADSNIIDKPEVALRDWLKNPELPKEQIFDKSNFKEDVYYNAYQLYNDVKNNLFAIANQEHLPPDEQEAYNEAIKNNFNAFSGDVVLKQYGAELHEVSAELNTLQNISKGEPKYLPKIKIGPSVLYAYLESCYSRDIAGGNLRKLLAEEYQVKDADLDESLHRAGHSSRKNLGTQLKVPCEVASIYVVTKYILKPSQIKMNVADIIGQLNHIQDNTVPLQFRKNLNDYLAVISPQKNVSPEGKPPKNERGQDLVAIPANSKTYYIKDLSSIVLPILENFSREPGQYYNLKQEQFDAFLEVMRVINELVAADKPNEITESLKLALRSFLTTDSDWDTMHLERPTSSRKL